VAAKAAVVAVQQCDGGGSLAAATMAATAATAVMVVTAATAVTVATAEAEKGVKRSTTQVAVAVAAMEGEDGMQWRRWGGRSMAESVA